MPIAHRGDRLLLVHLAGAGEPTQGAPGAGRHEDTVFEIAHGHAPEARPRRHLGAHAHHGRLERPASRGLPAFQRTGGQPHGPVGERAQ